MPKYMKKTWVDLSEYMMYSKLDVAWHTYT